MNKSWSGLRSTILDSPTKFELNPISGLSANVMKAHYSVMNGWTHGGQMDKAIPMSLSNPIGSG